MRVLINTLFTIPRRQLGATRTVTKALFSRMAQRAPEFSAEIVLLVSPTNEGYWRRSVPGAEFISTPLPTANRVLRIGLEQGGACHWAVHKTGADVFYCSSGAMPWLPLRCKSVIYLQNLHFFHFDEFYHRKRHGISWKQWLLNYRARDVYGRWACKNSLRQATEVLAVSHTMAHEAQHHTGVTRDRPIRIVPYGVNENFRPDGGKPRPVEQPYVVSVSSIAPHKNYEATIRAFTRLKQQHNAPHELHVLGGGPQPYVESLERLAARLGVGDSVHLDGPIPHDDLPAWYEHADAFVLNSKCESFGLPVLEAMAAGTPVVVSDRSGVRETAGDGGIVTNPDQPEQFAEQLHRVLSDVELREDLRKRGFKRAAEFSWDRAARQTMEYLQQACS